MLGRGGENRLTIKKRDQLIASALGSEGEGNG